MMMAYMPAMVFAATGIDGVESLSFSLTDGSNAVFKDGRIQFYKFNPDGDDEYYEGTLPAGFSYDADSNTITLDNVAIGDFFYRGTKDLNIHVIGSSKIGMIKVTDSAGVDGNNNSVCFPGGDIIIYGDGKNNSTLQYDEIWQDVAYNNVEPNADDGDIIIRNITMKGGYIEAAVSNVYIESSKVSITDGSLQAGRSYTEYNEPEGLLSVKDSVIELKSIEEQVYIYVNELELNGENIYSGNTKAEGIYVPNKNSNNEYVIAYNNYFLITPETITFPVSLANAGVKLSKSSYIYTGKAKKPAATVTLNGKTLAAGTDYKVSYASNVNVGTAKVTVTGIGKYKGTVVKTFTITKAANTLNVKGKTATVKYKTLKKKNQTVLAKNAFTVSKKVGKVTYKRASGNKKITVSSAGKITVKKGLKKGTYKVKVNVTAAGNSNYKPATKKVTVTIKVK